MKKNNDRQRHKRNMPETTGGTKVSLATQPANNGNKPKQNSTSGTTRFHVWRKWKTFWAVVGAPAAAIAIASTMLSFTPRISLDPLTNLDPDQSLNTRLNIKNIGRVPVWDVHFEVELKGKSMSIGELQMTRLEPIVSLSPDASVARQFINKSLNVTVPFVVVNVSYRWPIPFIRCETTRPFWFSVEHGSAGYLLMPASAQADLRTLIRIGTPSSEGCDLL